jgi:hypothetical protein
MQLSVEVLVSNEILYEMENRSGPLEFSDKQALLE